MTSIPSILFKSSQVNASVFSVSMEILTRAESIFRAVVVAAGFAGDVALCAALAAVRVANDDVAGLSAVGFGLLSNVRVEAGAAEDVFKTPVVFGLAAAVVGAAGLVVVLCKRKDRNSLTNDPI